MTRIYCLLDKAPSPPPPRHNLTSEKLYWLGLAWPFRNHQIGYFLNCFWKIDYTETKPMTSLRSQICNTQSMTFCKDISEQTSQPAVGFENMHGCWAMVIYYLFLSRYLIEQNCRTKFLSSTESGVVGGTQKGLVSWMQKLIEHNWTNSFVISLILFGNGA